MKVKIKKVEDHFPEWIKVGDEYDFSGEGKFPTIADKNLKDKFIIDTEYLEFVDEKGETTISIRESQLKAFQKAAILAKEYCQESLVEHEKKVGRSILRREIILEEGLKKDLEFLEGVVECFEDIWPEEYI